MAYWKGISLRAIAAGFAGGYCVPYLLLKGVAQLLAIFGITQLFGATPLFVVVLATVVAPTASGYLGAKYSSALPVLNGMSATLVGVVVFFLVGEMGGAFMYLVVIAIALPLSYVGAKRYVAYG